MELTTRELATVVAFVVAFVVGVLILLNPGRRQLGGGVVDLLRALAKWKVWTALSAYLTYATLVVLCANRLGFWSTELLKDTLIVVFFVGLPMVVSADSHETGLGLLKLVLKSAIGASALLVVYLNLAPLPFWGELTLQLIVTFLILSSLAVRHDTELRSVVKVVDALLALIGVGLFIHVTVRVAGSFSTFDWAAEGRAFALSVWLPLLLVPFAYVFAFLSACEATLALAKHHTGNRQPPPRRVGVAFVLGLRASLRYASAFNGRWMPELGAAASFRSGLATMRRFRASVRQNARENRARHRKFEENAGATGVRDDGLWRDRRQFHETKAALDIMFFTQMGLYKFHGEHYSSDQILVFPIEGFRGLPEEHCVCFRVSEDGQSWVGWRRTVGGFYLGVGGTTDLEAYWRYAGDEAPGFPGKDALGWHDVGFECRGSTEWDADDAPRPRA